MSQIYAQRFYQRRSGFQVQEEKKLAENITLFLHNPNLQGIKKDNLPVKDPETIEEVMLRLDALVVSNTSEMASTRIDKKRPLPSDREDEILMEDVEFNEEDKENMQPRFVHSQLSSFKRFKKEEEFSIKNLEKNQKYDVSY